MEEFYDAKNHKLNTEALIFAMWRHKNNQNEVNQFCDILCKFVDDQSVVDDFEFYLPQLTHMIIHLEADWNTSYLERFALMLSQTSMHSALQLTYLLIAAMEDYQAESGDGKANPGANSKLFFRCARLIRNIERAVIFCPPLLSYQTETVGSPTSDSSDLNTIDDAQRTKNSNTIINDSKSSKVGLSGPLYYKRGERKAFHLKRWKQRYFRIEHGVLFCYADSKYSDLRRALPLIRCEIKECKYKNYKYYFEVYNSSTQTTFRLYAENQSSYDQWISAIRRESGSDSVSDLMSPLSQVSVAEIDSVADISPGEMMSTLESVKSTVSYAELAEGPVDLEEHITDKEEQRGRGETMQKTLGSLNNEMEEKVKQHKLTEAQLKRYEFFHQQTRFVSDLTDICERLRFLDKEHRHEALVAELKKLQVQTGVYIPLCSSTSPWYYTRYAIPGECHAFSTKARCPALIFFESEKHPDNLDVASHLAILLSQSSREEEKSGEKGEAEESEDATASRTVSGTRLTLKDAVKRYSAVSSMWDKKSTSGSGSGSFMGGRLWRHGAGLDRMMTSKTLKSMTSNLSTSSRSMFNSSRATAGTPVGKTPESGPGTLQRMFSRGAQEESDDMMHMDDIVLDEVQKGNGSTAETSVPPSSLGPKETTEEVCAISKTKRVFGERFAEKASRLQGESIELRGSPHWTLQGLLAKSNDDLRQEVLVMQLIKFYDKVFKDAGLPLWLFTYRIMSTSKSTGLIELIPDAISFDGLKKKSDFPGSLKAHFTKTYQGAELEHARRNFMQSLAAYSVVTYLLAIKDRHNGNVMLDSDGHLIHIDFGFVFGLAPGKAFSMETAPWKLTSEMVEVFGGPQSVMYREYLNLVVQGFIQARRYQKQVEQLMEIMAFSSNFPGFRYNPNAILNFRDRLHLSTTDKNLPALVERLASRSYNHSGANRYDTFQLMTNGIAK